MTGSMKVLSNCSMNITPDVLNTICGLDKESIKVGELFVEEDMALPTMGNILVKINYTKGMQGDCYLIATKDTYNKVVASMMGMFSVSDMEGVSKEIKDSAICELMNQLSGQILSSYAEQSEHFTDISCPEIIEQDTLNISSGSKVIINLFSNPEENLTLKLINVIEEESA